MNKKKIFELIIVGIVAGVSVNLIMAEIEKYKQNKNHKQNEY